jgi:hypothetical protein
VYTSSSFTLFAVQLVLLVLLLTRLQRVMYAPLFVRMSYGLWTLGSGLGVLLPAITHSWANTSYGFPVICMGAITAVIAGIRGESFVSLR